MLVESIQNSLHSTCNVYELKGGATVKDKTCGIAKAFFLEIATEKKQRSTYEILINGKKLIFPTCSYPSKGPYLIFTGSKEITLEKVDQFIKVTEIDESSKTEVYVDSDKCIDGIAYDAYSYIPKNLTQEEAARKIQNLSEFPNFKPNFAVYNRHGVAVFGSEGSAYALYWANPHQESVKKMEDASCERYRDGGTSFGKSKDGFVNFRYNVGKDFYLNAELATKIALQQ